jgi:hypothetical protein
VWWGGGDCQYGSGKEGSWGQALMICVGSGVGCGGCCNR